MGQSYALFARYLALFVCFLILGLDTCWCRLWWAWVHLVAMLSKPAATAAKSKGATAPVISLGTQVDMMLKQK